jgi:two-component system response regulator GlrR
VTGPRGSGKELLARAIHGASSRVRKPFQVFRCGSAEESSEEESLFGKALAKGRGGILFLDDIGLLSPALQVRLLPLVGVTGLFSANPFDIRIIASTSENLETAVRDGRFRSDLYYTLKRNLLTVPGLAERREDIPMLITHFVTELSNGSPIATGGFSPDAMAMLCEAPWPGNVRQLRSVVHLSLAQTVVSRVPASVVGRLMQAENECEMSAFDDARRAFEYDYLARLLMATSGNVAQAARIAQRNRTEFYKLLARHNLDPAPFKQPTRK